MSTKWESNSYKNKPYHLMLARLYVTYFYSENIYFVIYLNSL